MPEALILFTAAFVHGLAGFAFALLAVPFLSFFQPLVLVVPLVALFGFTLNAIMLWWMRRDFRIRPVAGLLLGALPGVFLGAKALGFFPERIPRLILAVTVSGYALWEIFHPGSTRGRISPAWGPIFGLAAGFLGGLLNTPGPPVVIYVSLLEMQKDALKSALQGTFLLLVGGVILAHGLYGNLTPAVWHLYGRYLPAVLAGMILGQILYFRLGERSYRRLVHFLLLLSAGASLIRSF
ncbi:sulfite exporter TauE/SafE family protein [Thermosulfurimonas sp.]|uniref:sulfite exporter TauE/SafE family protein n=1 Tax=Thermosulfurimonas sp. TaxID=2080236 RepID=UPI0025E7C628|nr:sulfite exporter TauE/SafE family protein [Thermosulfurimonas sp.]